MRNRNSQVNKSVESLKKIQKKQLRFSNVHLQKSMLSKRDNIVKEDIQRKRVIEQSLKRFRNQPSNLKEYRSKIRVRRKNIDGNESTLDTSSKNLFSPRFMKKKRLLYESALQRSMEKKVSKVLLEIENKVFLERKRKYFNKWRNIARIKIVTSRKSLILRNKIRCRIMFKFFNLWKAKYKIRMINKYEEKILLEKALSLYSFSLKKKSLKRLQEYKNYRNVRNKIQETAYYFYYRRLCTKAIRSLQSYVLLRRKKREIKEFSRNVYLLTVKRMYFKKWRRRREESVEYQVNLKKAEKYNNFRLKRRGVWGFRKYVTYKGRRKEENEKCKLLYQKFVVKIHLIKWRKKREEKQMLLLEEKFGKIMEVKNLSILKNSITLWKRKTKEKIEEFKNNEIAVDFHTSCLLRKSFSRLLEYKKIREERKQHVIYADKLFKKRMLYRWRTKLRRKLRRKEKIKDLELHANKKIVRKYWNRWLEKRKLHILSIKKFEEAIGHHQKTLLVKVVRNWRKYSSERKTIRKVKREAEDFRSFSVRYRFVKLWRQKLHDKLEFEALMKEAVKFRTKKLLSKALKALQSYKTYRKQKRLQVSKTIKEAKKILKQKKKKRIFLTWRKYEKSRQFLKIQLEKGSRIRAENLRRKYLYFWRRKLEKQIRLKEIFEHIAFRKEKKVLSKCLQLWMVKTKESVESKKLNSISSEFYKERVLKRGYFQKWKMYLRVRKHRKKLKLEALERRKMLLKRRGILYLMKSSSETRKNRFIQKYPISEFRSFNLLEKYALHWRYLTMERLGKESFSSPKSVIYPIPRKFTETSHLGLKKDGSFLRKQVESSKSIIGVNPSLKLPSTFHIGMGTGHRPPPRRPVSLLMDSGISKSNLVTSPKLSTLRDPNEFVYNHKTVEEEKRRILREIREEVMSVVRGKKKKVKKNSITEDDEIESEGEETEGEIEKDGYSQPSDDVVAVEKERIKAQSIDKQKSFANSLEKSKIVEDIERIEEALRQYVNFRDGYMVEREERKVLKEQIELLEKLNQGTKSLKLVEYQQKLEKLNERARKFLEFKKDKIPKMKELLRKKYGEYSFLIQDHFRK